MLVVCLNDLHVYVVAQGLGSQLNETHGRLTPTLMLGDTKIAVFSNPERLLLAFAESRGANNHALA